MFIKNQQKFTVATRKLLQPDNMQILAQNQSLSTGGLPVISQPVERDLGPKPPDEDVRMEVSRDESVENEQMEKQVDHGGDNLMEEEEVQGTSFC